MRKYLQRFVFELCYYLELLISVALVIAIAALSLKLVISALDVSALSLDDGITVFLGQAMTIAVGVEFIKMLCKHTPATVIEVLLFAIARQMIVGHGSAIDTILGVAAIAGLFAVRKFLFNNYDETEKTVYRASQPIKAINMLAKIHIPEEDGNTLREVIVNKLVAEDKTIAIGSCVYYKEFALRIANMHGDVVTRVEVIKVL